MWSARYWRDLAERAIASTAAGALTAIGGDTLNVWDADYTMISGVAAGAGLIAVLKGLAAKTIGDRESAALSRDRAR
ncbi:holin [Haloechinothrix sp. YIM 98757]|uniref:Holin n=1 Tax=Haloechinothrix aidingensis TaxID=2752311 RepID=A0A838AAL7_9PSEU|nr:holin [Haloechinothrix aidingensis]MBA0126273.1 holin [Haloechinothrix aidingensis]